MKLKVYSVYDKKTRLYHPPSYCHNQEHAMRMFFQVMKGAGDTMSLYPEDFQIWELGTFDDSTGYIEVTKNPLLICEVMDLVRTFEEVKRKLEESYEN